ncbi:MAG TPA: hypothetical protein HA230_01700 [Candidatus Aenigmarchaeota archaeon]|nr:hypothetical protein [Candidatus Aenigmarchaeota archaeon]
MVGTDSREGHSKWLATHDPLLWKIVYEPDVCPKYGTPEHIKLGGSVGPVYEPPRWMEDAIREARQKNERLP